jgi:hypothetical protein
MKRTHLTLIAAAVGAAFSIAVSASPAMTKSSYDDSSRAIDAQYKTAKAACDALKGNAQDICEANAKGAKSVSQAELKADYKPSHESRYDARIAKADADYSVSMQMCDDRTGNDKDVCVKEAKAARVSGKANAKVQLKTADARTHAARGITAVRQDAAQDKRDAGYAVAREKCDALSGDAKAACATDAKSQYGKQ